MAMNSKPRLYQRRAFNLIVAVVIGVCFGARPGVAQQQSVGQWSPVSPTWPYFPVHTHALPTGKVMIWPGDGGISGNDPRSWDPAAPGVSPSPLTPPGYDVFCSGHSFLSDGRLFVAGGHIQNGVGLANASIYNPDPLVNAWTGSPAMNAGRWYPTVTVLANGDVLVVSGSIDNTVGVNRVPQVFQVGTGTWRTLVTAELQQDLFPQMVLAPNGKVFNSGPTGTTRYLDTAGSGTWSFVANRVGPHRSYGSAVMYAPGKVLVMGGGDPPTNTAEVIDLNQPTPSWRAVGSMAFARRQINATLLPDGKVLVTGGTSSPGFNDPTLAVHAAEVWDPDPTKENWTMLASSSGIPRVYHSTAVLLPDGRVLSMGGNGQRDSEIYSPPYLFNGARPTITSAPTNVAYGQTFFVETPNAASVTKVTMLRLTSVTHAFNMSQHISTLNFSPTTGGLNVVAPPSSNVAPPGHYLLFILTTQSGVLVPSVAKIVQITATGCPPAGCLQFSAATYSVAENVANATVTVTRTGGSSGAVSVSFATSNGTATAGSDYTAVSQTVSFANGDTANKTISIPIINDTTAEANETVNLTLSNPTGGAALGSPSTAVLTITDNDAAAGTLQFSAATYSVGENVANATVTVTRTGGSTGAVSVNFATSNGTATAPGDYTAVTQTVNFANGDAANKTINIPIIDDTAAEPNETVNLTLSGATLGSPSTAVLTITDNDAGGTTLSVSPTTIPAGGTVTATWSGIASPTPRDWIGLYTPGASNTGYIDWIYVSGSKTPGAAQASGSRPFVVPGSLAPGTYQLRLFANDTFTLLATSNNFTVTGGGGAGSLQFSAATYTVGENAGNAAVIVTRAGGSSGAVGVTFATSNGTATAPGDYTAVAQTVNFANGDTANKTVNIPIINDTAAEPNETVNLTLSSPTGGAALSSPSTAVVTITDNDGGGTTLSVSPTTIPAGGTVTATWSGIASPTPGDWIGLYTPGASNTGHIDWIYVSGSKTPGAAQASGSRPFVVPGSLAPGTYQLRLLANDGFTLLATSNNFTVTGGGGAGSLQFSAATYTVGENAGNAAVIVTRAGGSSGAVGVTFATSNGTATAPGDYTAVAQTVNFDNGDTANKTINIPIIDDTAVEGNETVNLTLSSPTGGAALSSPSTAVLTITDNDGGGTTLSVSPTTIPPGGTVTATWSGIASPTPTDWIGLYIPGAPNSPEIDWIYVSGSKTPGAAQASGSRPFVVPGSLAPGTYQLRLFANDTFTLLATSNNFTVQ